MCEGGVVEGDAASPAPPAAPCRREWTAPCVWGRRPSAAAARLHRTWWTSFPWNALAEFLSTPHAVSLPSDLIRAPSLPPPSPRGLAFPCCPWCPSRNRTPVWAEVMHGRTRLPLWIWARDASASHHQRCRRDALGLGTSNRPKNARRTSLWRRSNRIHAMSRAMFLEGRCSLPFPCTRRSISIATTWTTSCAGAINILPNHARSCSPPGPRVMHTLVCMHTAA